MMIKHATSINELFSESLSWEEPIFPLIYHKQDFLSFVSSAVGGNFHALVTSRDGVIRGFLPWFELFNPLYGLVINSLPWFGNQGACCMFINSDSTDVLSLLYAFKDYVDSSPDFFSATLNISPFDPYAKVYDKVFSDTIITPRTAQVLLLPQVIDDKNTALMSLFTSKTRNLVRKSQQQGFHAVDGDTDIGWDFLFQTHTENMNAIGGTSKLYSHFDAIRQFTSKARRILTLSMLNDEPVAALLCLYQKPCVEYFVPVIKREYRALQPMSFLIMYEMINAVKNNYTYWNFGGTPDSMDSLYHFKAGWGAIDIPYRYFTIISKEKNIVRADIERLLSAFPYYFSYPFQLISS